jgi:hypothetical protein
LLDEVPTNRQTDRATSVEAFGSGVGLRSQRESDEWQALDAAIASWQQEEPIAQPGVVPSTTGTMAINSPAPAREIGERATRARPLQTLGSDRSSRIETRISRSAALLALTAVTGSVLARRSKRIGRPGWQPTPPVDRNDWAKTRKTANKN